MIGLLNDVFGQFYDLQLYSVIAGAVQHGHGADMTSATRTMIGNRPDEVP
jgi:hypothetical protein